MKQLRYLMFFVASLVLSVAFYSCDDDCDCENSEAPVIHRVFLQDANSSVPDREVQFARLGQTIRIEGENLLGLTKVLINGYNNYFNPVFITNTSMVLKINENIPVSAKAPESVRNTIRLEKGGKFVVFDFEIRAGAPSINRISHTLPLAGEWVTVSGSGLIEVSKVVFPGDIEETIEIIQGVDGKFFSVKVPNGMPDKGGSIFIECANGGVYSPAYFGCKDCVILDFDGRGVHASWSANHISEDDLLSAPLPSDGVNKSQGKYAPMRPARIDTIKAGTPRATELWTTGDINLRADLVEKGLIKADAPLGEVAFQFDIYVPGDWNSTGFIGVNLANNFSAGNQWTGEFYNYIPWLNGSTKVPFKTPSGWITVSIPLNEFYAFSKGQFTFNDVLAFNESMSNKNVGLFFNNNDFTLKDITGRESDENVKFPSAKTTVEVYVDNLRIVSLYTKKYSDFSDDED